MMTAFLCLLTYVAMTGDIKFNGPSIEVSTAGAIAILTLRITLVLGLATLALVCYLS